MKKKICSLCHKSKTIINFYRNTKHADGLYSQCKICTKVTQDKYHTTINGLNSIKRGSKKYHSSKHGKIVTKNYSLSLSGKKVRKKINDRSHLVHSLLDSLRYYKKDFVIENCAICNSSKNIEMHHPNPDLSLHIYFLCRKHHLQQHGWIAW